MEDYVTKCCLCINIRTGANILGLLACLSLLQEVTDFIWWRCLIEASLSFFFILKWSHDVKTTRMLWFFAYIVLTIFSMEEGWRRGYKEVFSENGKLWDECTEMKNDGNSWASMGVTDMQGCLDHITPFATWGFWTVFAFLALLQLHFFAVTYIHW